jgi:tripartite-type tricarboxylate transporter receptor subunit TctC
MNVSALLLTIPLALGVPLHASAGAWPERPVHMVVPVGAGSTTDIIPRAIADELSTRLGEQVVVENRSGAGGTIGTAEVARARPDGYTLLAHSSAYTIAPAMYSRLSYDAARDFEAVVPFGSSPGVLVVSPASPYRTVAGLIAAGKQRPGALTFSSVGIGTATHLSAERFLSSAGVTALHVPMKGGAEAITEVLAGRCDFFFAPLALALPQVRAGKLRALVVNGTQRAAALPDVPTTREAGLVDAEYPIWFGLFAPANTPRAVVDQLNRETEDALSSPALRKRLAAMGVDPMPMGPEQFQAFVQHEIALNAALVKRIGIKPE